MKKHLTAMTSALCCALAFGCSAASQFQLSAKTPKQTVVQGEVVRVTVYTKNTGAPYKYLGSSTKIGAVATLYTETDEGKYYLSAQPMAATSDLRNVTIKHGEEIVTEWIFNVEADAALGAYTLLLSYAEDTVELSQFITVEKAETSAK